MKLYHTGSTKLFYLNRRPTSRRLGLGELEFAEDDFSVFDYGKFPWKIRGKAETLYQDTIHFFNLMNENGIPNHFVKDLGNRRIKIRAGRIPKNYEEIIPGKTVNYLIPLEIVFTNTVSPVSSLHRDLRSGKINPEDLGLDRIPEKGEYVSLPRIYVRFSTKIEATDEYRGGLSELAGLVNGEPQMLISIATDVGHILRKDSAHADFDTIDGKIECIMDHRRRILVGDTCYTPDECRKVYHLPNRGIVDFSKQWTRDVLTIVGYKKALKHDQREFPNDKSMWPDPAVFVREIGETFFDGEFQKLSAEQYATDRMVTIPGALAYEKGAELRKTCRKLLDAKERLTEKYRRYETGEEF